MTDIRNSHVECSRLLGEKRTAELYRTIRAEFLRQDAIGHNWEHVRRDILNAAYIGTAEGADMEIVMPAVILHDIGYFTHPGDPGQHPLHGSKECYRFLKDWTPAQRDKISFCILKHKGKYPGFEHSEPETLEECVVCDADQIDKFGWTGFVQILKVYVEYAEQGNRNLKTMRGLAASMKHQAGIVLYTKTGKQMAAERKEPDFIKIAEKIETELSAYDEWTEPE